MSKRGDCTCPPTRDVFRGHVVQTRESCPIHPEPEFPPGTFLPRVDGGPISTVDLARPASCRHPIEARIAHGPHYYQSCGRCGEDVP